jgi:peptide-methionine (R)-S-oxide reductase
MTDVPNKSKTKKNDEEWRKKLTPEEYEVLRLRGTEPPFTGKYVNNKEKGVYVCAGCGQKLFRSDTKYDSGSGWPSFWAPVSEDNLQEVTDKSHGMIRIEVLCKNCGGHLGHVFDDGPKPTGLRYCINSRSLKFKSKKGKDK